MLTRFAADSTRVARLANLTLICGDITIKVHSFVLEIRSKFFSVACSGPWKEAKTRETSLPDNDPFMVRRMLDHAYMRLYPETKSPSCSPEKEEATYMSKLSTYVQMYALGEKYGMEGLKEEAAWRFQENLKPLRLRSELPGMLEVVPAIYTTTPESDRGLRDHVVNICASGWKLIKTVPEFKAIALRSQNSPGFSDGMSLWKMGKCAREESDMNWGMVTAKEQRKRQMAFWRR
ncbi:hypothetical protein OEA41_009828 [Lepraria neglecta]|uniref:BTB domain-containing protein n=1 Tax=Lepraria neglecta TaxID=209136 RepID=A0AAD9YZN8_9LECA|nr:hypothetical protein OEA41_009828 [Lepraria neglecta]